MIVMFVLMAYYGAKKAEDLASKLGKENTTDTKGHNWRMVSVLEEKATHREQRDADQSAEDQWILEKW